MERVKALGRYQKGILLVMLVMCMVFTAVYAVAAGREGFAYRGAILLPHTEDGSTVYSGRIEGKSTAFTVDADKTVYFQYDGKTYGPYTAKEDATALPEDGMAEDMIGVELRAGERILFRGGVSDAGGYLTLHNEDGSAGESDFDAFGMMPDGVETDGFGDAGDPMEPSAITLLKLMGEPTLTHRGDWTLWFGGVVLCVLNTISILYVKELFRWNLRFRIRNAEAAEPSACEIVCRYVGWTALAVAALMFFIMGLR